MVLWSTVGCCDEPWQRYVQFALIATGVYGARLWTALLAVALYLLRTRSLCFVLRLRPYFALVGWGAPAVIAAVILATVQPENPHVKSDPDFQVPPSEITR